jgi:magnesium chelatase family protein
VQVARYAKNRIYCNAQLKSVLLREHCALDKQSRQLLKSSVQQLSLSARAHDKVLRLARTVADVEGAASLAARHLQEAINYRMLDRQL